MALVVFDVGPDPDLYSLWHSGADPGSLNFAYARGWGLIDKDLEDGRAAVEQPERLAAYSDFQSLIADQAPAIFLYSAHYDYAVSGRVRGVRLGKCWRVSDGATWDPSFLDTTEVTRPPETGASSEGHGELA